MSKELFFLGEPAPFKRGIQVYPPKVIDVVQNPKYSLYVKVLTYSQEEIEDEFVEAKRKLDSFPTPIEFLLNNCYHNADYQMIVKEAFEFFTKQKVNFFYEQKLILFGDIQEVVKALESVDDLQNLVTLKEEDFFDFQNLVRLAARKKPVERPNPNEHPRIKAMKAKARYRDRVKAKQAAKNGISLSTSLAAICCMGIGLTPLNIGEMSYVAMEELIGVYQSKEKYQLDIDSLLAGADSKKIKPKYWIRNLEE